MCSKFIKPLCLLILLSVAINSDAQNLGDIRIHPENPTTNDTIYVFVYWLNCHMVVLNNVELVGNVVSVELFNSGCPITTPGGMFWHTVELIRLPPGDFEFNVVFENFQYSGVVTVSGAGPDAVNTLHPFSLLLMSAFVFFLAFRNKSLLKF